MATRGWGDHLPPELAGRVRSLSTPLTGRTSDPPVPRRKYRNTRYTIGEITFDSKAEADYWLALKDRERRGEIHNLARQIAFALNAPVVLGDGQIISVQVAMYVADFVYYEAGVRHVVDVKRPATVTAVYRLKRKWLELQTGIAIEEVAG